MDYKLLLTKYMSLVLDIEGVTLVDYADRLAFTEPELEKLKELQEHAFKLVGRARRTE